MTGRYLAMQSQRRMRRRWEVFDRWAPRIIFAVLVIDAVYLTHHLAL